VNPLLAGLGVWLTYRLGKKVFKDTIGLLAAFLTLTSPFFLINSGTLLSHPWSYVLSAIFALTWLDSFQVSAESKTTETIPGWIPVIAAGLSLGLLALTRPLTALGVALPFFIHAVILLVRGTTSDRLRVVSVGGISLCLAFLFFVWQYGVT
jgi:4-amino-4-deoxy-L-arabinose transferase-like glycosyltransferase